MTVHRHVLTIAVVVALTGCSDSTTPYVCKTYCTPPVPLLFLSPTAGGVLRSDTIIVATCNGYFYGFAACFGATGARWTLPEDTALVFASSPASKVVDSAGWVALRGVDTGTVYVVAQYFGTGVRDSAHIRVADSSAISRISVDLERDSWPPQRRTDAAWYTIVLRDSLGFVYSACPLVYNTDPKVLHLTVSNSFGCAVRVTAIAAGKAELRFEFQAIRNTIAFTITP